MDSNNRQEIKMFLIKVLIVAVVVVAVGIFFYYFQKPTIRYYF